MFPVGTGGLTQGVDQCSGLSAAALLAQMIFAWDFARDQKKKNRRRYCLIDWTVSTVNSSLCTGCNAEKMLAYFNPSHGCKAPQHSAAPSPWWTADRVTPHWHTSQLCCQPAKNTVNIKAALPWHILYKQQIYRENYNPYMGLPLKSNCLHCFHPALCLAYILRIGETNNVELMMKMEWKIQDFTVPACKGWSITLH